VIIENVGGGGMTGTARGSGADGYQFVFASVDSMAIVPAMHRAAALQQRDRFHRSRPGPRTAVVLITRKDLPVNTLQEFVAYARQMTKMQFGSSGSAPARISPVPS
jgi:tripartite-type tricarboxylate transporter receptor subunit TctC